MKERKKKHIAILGSTGSIGRQALEVINDQRDLLEVELLSANTSFELLIQQAREFIPNTVIILNESLYQNVQSALEDLPIKVYCGMNSLCQAMAGENIDLVLTSMVGFAGLKPTLAAIENKKPIALANKETLVVAGAIITQLARENGVNIYPVDSEHSAIFQCLAGEWQNPVEKIILTASGGPFRNMKGNELKTVTSVQALKHPNWNMGNKITIDSATLMNKGLEVIEAYWLFQVPAEKIEVVIHPQSIIHSMVQFADGSIKAQMGLPDMKLPIQYALLYPHRMPNSYLRFDFQHYSTLTFEKPDTETFRNLALAYEALKAGGNSPCVLNAANEVAVEAFLNSKISFPAIWQLNQTALERIPHQPNPSYSDLIQIDSETRKFVSALT
jgi:1-deoxy-D-xylulose-5-phosphate reductoisomerase